MPASPLPPASPASRDLALEVLLGRDLEPVVDMVAWSIGTATYEVASAEGWVRFRRRPEHGDFDVVAAGGRDPIGRRDPGAFASLEVERRTPHPHRRANSYPHAYEQFAQLFDHPSAPDLCVIHSAAHNWEDQGGHRGEHGSLGVTQARAPFVAAGAGVQPLGALGSSCRLVDVTPTVLALLGAAPDGEAPDEGPTDGQVLAEILDGAPARHVVGLLFDGANANVLYDLAATGGAPNVARLMDAGVSYRHGAISSLPTVTLPNHTSILTGAHPGHHGILHNAWVDRATGDQVVTNSPATWATAMRWLAPGVSTVHDRLHRRRPGAVTAAVNEPCEVGADYSTFDRLRRGDAAFELPAPDDVPDATERFVRPSKDYRWSTQVDHTAVEQFVSLWSGADPSGLPVPAFTWVNFTLTDSAFHEGGPYSEMAAASVADTDARLGRILDAVERSGRLEETAFVLVADHGMGETDPAVRGDWDAVLADHGVAVRDEGYGFLYLAD